MTDNSGQHAETIERVGKFWKDVEQRAEPNRQQAFAYEQLAVEFSKKGFETLTYLNGGALVALPAALAFFKAEVPTRHIIAVAGAFVVGLLAVVIAQVMAFFTMAKRAEMYQFREHEALSGVSAIYNPLGSPGHGQREAEANEMRAKADARRASSNRYRRVGLCVYVISVLAFVVGCVLGAAVVALAKAG
jgi:hypothetical protein